MNTLEKYNIKNKVFALTIDNTTTNKAVTYLLQKKLSSVNIIFIRCIYYILNFIIKIGLTEMNQLQQKVYNIWQIS